MNKILQEDLDFILNDKNINWHLFEGKTVFISGAGGFLAKYILKTLLYANKKLLSNPVKVVGLVRNLAKAKNSLEEFFDDKNLCLIQGDVVNRVDYSDKIDFIIHAASLADPEYFFTKPADVIKANTIGTSNMLELAVFKKVEGFLFFSTGEVNGNIFDKKKSVKEDDYGVVDPLDVRNCYAESKRMGENMCASWAHQFNVPVKIVRPSHTYGPGLSLTDGRAFASFTAAVLNNRNIILKSNGEAKRSFCYIADAVRAYFLVLLNGKNGQVYNVSNDYEISIKKMAEIIINASNNKKLSLEFDIDEKSVSSKVSHGLLDNSKIKKLGWSPVIKEKEGFKRTLESFI